ncbi:MAG TPA: DUF4440 domain-containing protein [Terriglobales bacterium]|nr:DUF4440 domain-containing protein [Terriglobales bacterium]
MRSYALCLVVLFAATLVAAGPEEELLQFDRQFNQSFNAAPLDSRADKWMSYFADNAAIPSTPPVAGRQALTDHYRKVFANPDFTLKWEPSKGEVFGGGNMGYTVGKYVAGFKDKNGQSMEQTGAYITVWKKQADGSWKIVADTGSEDGPAHAAK